MNKMKCNTVLCLHWTDGTRNRHNHHHSLAGSSPSGQASHCSNLCGTLGGGGALITYAFSSLTHTVLQLLQLDLLLR